MSSSDPEKNIWGFKSTSLSSKTITDNKLLLNKNLSYSNPILSNPWINNHFFNSPDESDVNFDGRHFIITVNLRRADLQNDTTKSSDVVLSIVLPYYFGPKSNHSVDSGYIKFDQVPDTSVKVQMKNIYQVGTIHDTINRGYYYGMKNNTGSSSTFFITRDMLPTKNDTSSGIGPDITLSASFTCTGNFPANKLFKSSNPSSSLTIDSLGLEVHYNGNSSILLNYIRIGTPESDKLFKGEYDTIIHNFFQRQLKILNDSNYHFFRFYVTDEMSDMYELWDMMRYFNLLTNRLCTHEGSSQDPKYRYHIEATDLWLGGFGTVLGAP